MTDEEKSHELIMRMFKSFQEDVGSGDLLFINAYHKRKQDGMGGVLNDYTIMFNYKYISDEEA